MYSKLKKSIRTLSDRLTISQMWLLDKDHPGPNINEIVETPVHQALAAVQMVHSITSYQNDVSRSPPSLLLLSSSPGFIPDKGVLVAPKCHSHMMRLNKPLGLLLAPGVSVSLLFHLDVPPPASGDLLYNTIVFTI